MSTPKLIQLELCQNEESVLYMIALDSEGRIWKHYVKGGELTWEQIKGPNLDATQGKAGTIPAR